MNMVIRPEEEVRHVLEMPRPRKSHFRHAGSGSYPKQQLTGKNGALALEGGLA